VFRVERKRGPHWYAKYRLPDGRQVQRRLGPAWTERGRPPSGYFTKRTAEDWLRSTLEQARRGELPGMVRTGATVAGAAAEYLRYVEEDRGRKASTVEDYRSIIRVHLLPAFGETRLEDITPADVEAFAAALVRREHRDRRITPRTRIKVLNVLHGLFARAKKVWGLSANPAVDVERPPQRLSGDIDVFSAEEVWCLVRAAGDERAGAIYLTALTGLRIGELRALRWRDVDFPRSVIRVRSSYAAGTVSVPKSGKVRSGPMVVKVARQRPRTSRLRTSRWERGQSASRSHGLTRRTSTQHKWDAWILATPGHGADWHGMFGAVRKEAVWDAILAAIETAPHRRHPRPRRGRDHLRRRHLRNPQR
jgi:integrase